MAKCVYCEKEFQSQRATAKFCSDSCRVKWNRKISVTSLTPQKLLSVTKPEISVTENMDIVTLKNESVTLTANQLYSRINSYPGNTWKHSPEYKELIQLLKTMSVEDLVSQCFTIPNWKHINIPCPIVL